ncbi:MAG: hemerythrin family protein [Magnetococcales bacterium]|nr:hemerythrin family protein [Magnetococcales bacterium]
MAGLKAKDTEEKSLLQLMDEAALAEKSIGSSQQADLTHQRVRVEIFSRLEKIGLPDIDQQHEQLVQYVCNLYKVIAVLRQGVPSESDKALFYETVEGLQNYTVDHFRDEEAYMEKIGYPDLADHQAVHQEFVKKFLTIRKAEQKGEITIAIDLFFLVYRWLFDHINRVDVSIAQFGKEEQ